MADPINTGRIAAIRTEIAEEGHHPGPDSLVNQDLLALCDEVDRLRVALAATARFLDDEQWGWRHDQDPDLQIIAAAVALEDDRG